MFLVAAVVVEYLVLPQIAGSRKALQLLGRVDARWLLIGFLLEVGSIVAFAQLTRSLLPAGSRTSLGTTARITLSTLGISHVVPGGTVAGASLGYRLLAEAGITGSDAGFALATQGLGSAMVLNVLLWIGLVVTIPLRGFSPIYGTAAFLGALLLAGFFASVLLLTKGEDRVVRVVCRVATSVPFLDGDALSAVLRRVSQRVDMLLKDRPLLVRAAGWAALNWLLDAASLWVFLAAFGHRMGPDGLLVAYGLAYVLAAIPVTPGGLGVVEAVLTSMLVAFGATRGVALLGVVSYRLVNFWLPIPLGGIAYLSLRVDRRRDRREEVEMLKEETARAIREEPTAREWAGERGISVPAITLTRSGRRDRP
ncbi:MAG: putative heme transporter [Actinomycetota bacterium]|nr:putative heme transporter [Actinomycetota bacterium]